MVTNFNLISLIINFLFRLFLVLLFSYIEQDYMRLYDIALKFLPSQDK